MNAGAGFNSYLELVLDLDTAGLDLGFKVAPFCQGQILEHHPVGVPGAPLAYRSLLSTIRQPHPT